MLALIDDKIFKIEYLENFKATIEKSDKKETPPKRNYQLQYDMQNIMNNLIENKTIH